jgi:hypothetical protein
LFSLWRADDPEPVAGADEDEPALDWPPLEAAPPAPLDALEVGAPRNPTVPADLSALDAELALMGGRHEFR